MCMWIRLNLNLIHPSAAFVLHCVIMYAQWVCHYVHAAIPCTSLVRICIEHHGSLHNTAAGKYLPCSAPYTLRDILKTHAHCHLLACSFSCDWLQQPPHTNSVWFAWQQPATHVLLMQHVGLMQGSHTHAESISLCVPPPPRNPAVSLYICSHSRHCIGRTEAVCMNPKNGRLQAHISLPPFDSLVTHDSCSCRGAKSYPAPHLPCLGTGGNDITRISSAWHFAGRLCCCHLIRLPFVVVKTAGVLKNTHEPTVSVRVSDFKTSRAALIQHHLPPPFLAPIPLVRMETMVL
jgi:hypothetical protein